MQVQDQQLPALSEDNGVDNSKYEWKYVSKEIRWVYSLKDKLPTDVYQVEKPVDPRSYDSESDIHVASQMFERIDTDQNRQAGFEAPPTGTKAPPSSGSQVNKIKVAPFLSLIFCVLNILKTVVPVCSVPHKTR